MLPKNVNLKSQHKATVERKNTDTKTVFVFITTHCMKMKVCFPKPNQAVMVNCYCNQPSRPRSVLVFVPYTCTPAASACWYWSSKDRQQTSVIVFGIISVLSNTKQSCPIGDVCPYVQMSLNAASISTACWENCFNATNTTLDRRICTVCRNTLISYPQILYYISQTPLSILCVDLTSQRA